MLNWYVVRTIVQREARSELRLRECGYQTYLPRTKRFRSNQKPDSVALFPGYFFLHTDWRSLTPREKGWDILHLLDMAVPDDAMEELWSREDDGVIALPERYKLGQEIEITQYGMFFGHHGLYQGMTPDGCVSVLMTILGRPCVPKFSVADVRAAVIL